MEFEYKSPLVAAKNQLVVRKGDSIDSDDVIQVYENLSFFINITCFKILIFLLLPASYHTYT